MLDFCRTPDPLPFLLNFKYVIFSLDDFSGGGKVIVVETEALKMVVSRVW